MAYATEPLAMEIQHPSALKEHPWSSHSDRRRESRVRNRSLGRALYSLLASATAHLPTLFGYQFFALGRKP